MTERKRAIGIFNDIENAEAALEELNNSHYSLDRVFVIANNTAQEDRIVGTELCQSLRERFDTRINNNVAKNSDTDIKHSISLTQALSQLDIPVNIARSYDNLVSKGKYLVMVEGSEDDILGAKTILKRCGIQDWVIYKIVLEHPEVIIVDRREAS